MRTKARSRARLAWLLPGVLCASCVVPSPERQALLDFFAACRAYDTTEMARLGTAPCNPRQDGVVEGFEIVELGEERSESGALPSKMVTLSARVRPLDGAAATRMMSVTLERNDRRWLVAALTPLPASQTEPAASSARPN